MIIKKYILLGALEKVVTGIGKSNMPILDCIKLTAGEEKLRLEATHLNYGAIVEIPEADETFGCCVNGYKFLEIIKCCETDIRLTVNSNRLQIDSGNSHFTLPVFPVDSFPVWLKPEEKEFISVNRELFIQEIEKVRYAASMSESRLNLDCLFFDTNGELVATDGHRLTLSKRRILGELPQKLLLDRIGIDKAIKFLTRYSSNDMYYGIYEKYFVIRVGHDAFAIQLRDGDYPDYNKLLSGLSHDVVFTDTETSLKAAINRVSVMASDAHKAIRLEYSNSKLSLVVDNPQVGKAEDVIEVKGGGGEVELILNLDYILNTLDFFKVPEISISSKVIPVTIKEFGSDSYLALVMPMRA